LHGSSFESAVLSRHSCKKFQRFDGSESGEKTASAANPDVVEKALHILDLARRTPSSYNTQPWKIVLVHSAEQKLALSRHCLGPNKARVLDSDCTAIFLADRQIFRTFPRYRQFVDALRQPSQQKPSRKEMYKKMFYITLFSSGYPLPQILRALTSFCVRTAVAFLHLLTKWFYPLPTLSNAETWSSKQTMMVAMTYMIGCASMGLSTIPMEGFNAGGIRKVIRAPSRFAIPVIVSTGSAHQDSRPRRDIDDRYPMKETVFQNAFDSATS
jgi:nitroreductase